jgi:hypothetical protein
MPANPVRLLIAGLFRLAFAFRPPSDFVLTGLPRSGTSLLSALLSESPNCFCFNEILYDPDTLSHFFMRMRRRLLRGRPVPVKVDSGGGLTTDTLVGRVDTTWKTFEPKAKPLVLGSNVNVPYLECLPELRRYGYRTVAMIRDPVFTLASWGSPKGVKIPEAHVSDEDMNPRWRKFAFDSDDEVERRATIWQYYADRIAANRETLTVIRYEDLCDRQDEIMRELCQLLGISEPREQRRLENLNREDRFTGLEQIRQVVSERCPARLGFGYSA